MIFETETGQPLLKIGSKEKEKRLKTRKKMLFFCKQVKTNIQKKQIHCFFYVIPVQTKTYKCSVCALLFKNPIIVVFLATCFNYSPHLFTKNYRHEHCRQG